MKDTQDDRTATMAQDLAAVVADELEEQAHHLLGRWFGFFARREAAHLLAVSMFLRDYSTGNIDPFARTDR